MAPRINFLSSGLFRECLHHRDYKCLITVTFDLQRLGKFSCFGNILPGPRIVWNGAMGVAKKSVNLNKSGSGAVESTVSRSHGHHSCCAISSWIFLHHMSNRQNTSRRQVFEYPNYISNLQWWLHFVQRGAFH